MLLLPEECYDGENGEMEQQSSSSNAMARQQQEKKMSSRRRDERRRCQEDPRTSDRDCRWRSKPRLLRFFLLLLSSLRTAEACMPGYEGERSRLRQYLGIEWTPGGLAKMDAEQPRFARHPSELNCDFSKPEKCKWQNVQKGGLDSLNFYLFRKEDNTEFPVVQIRPGPSKVPVGDQLLLVGDRRRQEQSAILASHPIKCQNSTGRLTFSFWLYNGARLEVLILEEQDEQLHALPEKPQIDCGTVQMNTECTVLIPPSDKPFRIALRAYDIRNPEGSFVMVDNLLYEAQFCKVSIDFGPDFHSEPLLTGAKGEFVRTASELSCSEFEGSCRWRNLGHGESGVWRRAVGTPPPSMVLFNETGTHIQPTLPAAFLYVPEGSQAGLAQPGGLQDASTADEFYRMFVSDPLQCANPASVSLQFKVWATKGIKLSCCLLEPRSMRVLGPCQPVLANLSPAPAEHRFQTDNDGEFMFAIRVDSVNTDFDNFVFLDQLELLGADSCGQGGGQKSGWLTGGSLYTAPLLSTLLGRPVHSAKELACDFTKRGLNCQWANLERIAEGMSPWEVGIVEKQQRQGGEQHQLLLPDGDVGFTRLDGVLPQFLANGSAVLLSERIQCTLDDGQTGSTSLSFRSWHSGDSRLGVCIVRANSLEVLDCQNVHSTAEVDNDGEQILVEIPRLDEPVRLAFRAESTGAQGGLVALDDIAFQGTVCAVGNAVAFSGKSGFGRSSSGGQSQQDWPTQTQIAGERSDSWHLVPDENVCRLLSCDFNREAANMCLYSSPRVASSVSMFRAYNRSAFAMLFTRSRVAMLESPLFHLNTPARLHFDFAISRGPANLHICQDSVMRELDSCFDIFSGGQTAGWKHDFVEVLPTDRKLYVIAKLQGPGKASVQLDNFELTDVSDHRVC